MGTTYINMQGCTHHVFDRKSFFLRIMLTRFPDTYRFLTLTTHFDRCNVVVTEVIRISRDKMMVYIKNMLRRGGVVLWMFCLLFFRSCEKPMCFRYSCATGWWVYHPTTYTKFQIFTHTILQRQTDLFLSILAFLFPEQNFGNNLKILKFSDPVNFFLKPSESPILWNIIYFTSWNRLCLDMFRCRWIFGT